MKNGIKTTGQLRAMLADAARQVMDGDMDIERANALHKIAKNISDSLYSETKIAMFRADIGQQIDKFGAMEIGDPTNSK